MPCGSGSCSGPQQLKAVCNSFGEDYLSQHERFSSHDKIAESCNIIIWNMAAEIMVVRVAALLVLLGMLASVQAQLVHDFYRGKCRHGVDVERLVNRVVRSAYDRNRAVAPGLIRMHFHDAFVLGADASVLINATGSERFAFPNLSLQAQAFEVVDTAKAVLEALCPGVVSCADILTFAARDSVGMTFGGRFPVRSGRRDGLASSSSDVNSKLPRPVDGVTELTNAFTAVGLTQADMVILSGAHTVGVSHCQTISGRLYNFSSTNPTDPSLDPVYAAALKARCPKGAASDSTPVDMDPLTPNIFDVGYYRGLQAHKGLFPSDQALFDNPATRPLVDTYSAGGAWRFIHYPVSFNKMAEINVSTGTLGEIRQSCWKFNSS